MKTTRRLFFLLITLLSLLPLGLSWANVHKYSDELREVLRFNNEPDSKQSIIIHLTDKVDIQSLDTRLYYQRVTRQYRHETVIRALQETAQRSQPAVRAVLDEMVADGRVDGYTPYWIFNGFVVYATPVAIEELSNLYTVDHIEMNFQSELIEPIRSERNPLDSDANTPPPGIVAINAPRVWYELGINGAGTLVGDLDTGAQGSHPALAARWRGNFAPAVECWRAPVSGSGTPTDANGHGTHTLGTMCGATNGGTGDTVGVAPAARWIADDAIGGNTGAVFDNSVVDAYQWMADPDGNPGTVFDMPDVCNNSWGVNGSFAGYSDCDHRWDAAIIALEAAGCVVEFSAGNEGSGAQTLRSPANQAFDSVSFFSTGAVSTTPPNVFPYPIASFSSRGPSDCVGSFIKPEISAPGVSVYSSVPGSTYDGTYSGTSMAGPHVCGTVALMRQANPDIDVRDIKSILIRTARDEGTAGKDNTYGWGFLDAYAAVQEVLARANYGRVIGTVRDANTLAPLTATVQVVGGGQSTVANGLGAYLLLIPGDSSYTIRYSQIGYFSQDIPVVIVGQDTVIQDVNLIPRPVITVLVENFESGAADWTHTTPGGQWIDQWHISTERAFNGSSSYKCGDAGAVDYAAFNDARLVSPTLNNLPEQAQLKFYYQIESETSVARPDSCYDGGLVEISVNGGAFQLIIPVGGYLKTFRYTTNGTNPVSGPMPGLPCYAGTVTTWTNTVFDLTAFAGQNIQLRWRFGSDAGGNREGWYVDSVTVVGYGNTIALTEIDSLVISTDGNDIFLDWPADTNPFYRVYSDTLSDGPFTDFEGSTTTNTFTVTNGAQNDVRRLYVIVAWDGVGNPIRSRPVRLEE